MTTNRVAPVPVRKVPTIPPPEQLIYCWHASCMTAQTGMVIAWTGVASLGTILAWRRQARSIWNWHDPCMTIGNGCA